MFREGGFGVALSRFKRVRQESLWVPAAEVRMPPAHRFYEALNGLLREAGFDERVEGVCAAYYEPAGTPGRPSVAPGVYFRMLLVGYFEGIESERGICWRCADSLSLRSFLGLSLTDRVPDHSSLSRIRARLPDSVFDMVFTLVLGVVRERGLLRGEVLGVDSTYLRADASMKGIERRDTGEDYGEFIQRLAREAGVEGASAEDARRFDRSRRGKRVSNGEWLSPVDADARIARLKDGRTRLAYKPEHVVDLASGALVAVEVHSADRADSATLAATLAAARAQLQRAGGDSAADANDDDRQRDGGQHDGGRGGEGGGGVRRDAAAPIRLVADKGYHKASVLRDLNDGGYRTIIPEPRRAGRRRWVGKGGRATARAYYLNRQRVRRPLGKRWLRSRGEKLERSFAHTCESGAARRSRLRGLRNVRKRYLITGAAFNLALVLRRLLGAGTPRGLAERTKALRGTLASALARLAGATTQPSFPTAAHRNRRQPRVTHHPTTPSTAISAAGTP